MKTKRLKFLTGFLAAHGFKPIGMSVGMSLISGCTFYKNDKGVTVTDYNMYYNCTYQKPCLMESEECIAMFTKKKYTVISVTMFDDFDFINSEIEELLK
jgi:hypothetical protein